MKKIFEKTVFSNLEDSCKCSCCFPAMYQLSDGRIIASFRNSGEKGPYNRGENVLCCVSCDMGETWSEAYELFKAPVIDGKCTTLRTLYFIEDSKDNLIAVANAVDGTMEEMPYYNEETEGLKDTYILVSHSADMGENWSEFKRVQVETFKDMPLPLTGAPFKTAEGRIGIQFEVNKPYYEKEYWVHHSAVIYSEDGGKTWGNEVVITDNPRIYYWDQRISVLDDNSVADIFWTFDRDKGDYINIHMCTSSDGGRSFGELKDIGLSGQPGNVISGKNGEMIAIYINRDASPIIKLATSENGSQWKDVMTVYDSEQERKSAGNAGMNDVWKEMGAFCVGHPFLCKLSDGDVLAYYYSGKSTHKTEVKCVKIRL